MAIDRAAMVKGILDGAGEPAYGPIDPTQASFDRSTVPYDPAHARVLLDDAGWKEIRSDGIRYDNAGRKLAFKLMYPAEVQIWRSEGVQSPVEEVMAPAVVCLGHEALSLDLDTSYSLQRRAQFPNRP
jgi:ABC-type transport system substrate-binding protein